MNGALKLIFAKLETAAFLQLRHKWILTKFGGCGSEIGPAMSIWGFGNFWQEIQIWGI